MSRVIARYDQVLTVANLPDQLAHKGLVVFHEQDLRELGASPGYSARVKPSSVAGIRASGRPSSRRTMFVPRTSATIL